MDLDPDSSAILFQLLFLVFLTCINAFFASAEMAVVSVNKNKIRLLAEAGNKNALLIQKLFKDSTKFLSTIQVAITFAGFFSSASAATGISLVLGNYLAQFSIPYSSTIAMVVVTIILSYFTLVFGELVPKRIALQKAESFSLFCVVPVYTISRILSPFIKLLSLSTNGVLRLIGMKTENLEEEVSEEEIRALIQSGSEKGVFNEIEKEMINSVFSFDDKSARDVMVPRQDVYMWDIDDAMDEKMDEILTTRFSRIPVYKETSDDIIGILPVKDLMIQLLKKPVNQIDIASLLQQPYFVPESKNTDELLRDLQKTQNRMAILIDEYGGFSGITTVEDLVEEIVGDLNDEYELADPDFIQLDSGHYLVDGMILIEELNDRLHLKLKTDYYETLSGYLIEKLGRIPSKDDLAQIQDEDCLFLIRSMVGKRVGKVEIQLTSVNTKQKGNEAS